MHYDVEPTKDANISLDECPTGANWTNTNKFLILAGLEEEAGIPKDEVITTSRWSQIEASSSQPAREGLRETKGEPRTPLEGEADETEEDIEAGFVNEEGIVEPFSSVSSRHKKREAKMKFSGSRSKGRHRS